MSKQITWEEYDELAGQGSAHMLVDVREESEWQAGHAAEAVHIPLGELAERAPEVLSDHSALIITCCRTGGRASRAAEQLAGAGYQNVASIVGDFGDHYH